MNKPNPPQTISELLSRAESLKNLTLFQLASLKGEVLPKHFLKNKGWLGQLLEWYLGCDATNLSEPDFMALQIELKSLPLDAKGKPKESTYVCTAPTGLEALNQTWETSAVKRKLNRVLFIPFEASPLIPIPNRRILSPLFWQMSPATEMILKQDWEELIHMLHLGEQNQVSGRFGTYLQLRPKAAHSRILSTMIDLQGDEVLSVPKGFYLRSLFTKKLMNGLV